MTFFDEADEIDQLQYFMDVSTERWSSLGEENKIRATFIILTDQ